MCDCYTAYIPFLSDFLNQFNAYGGWNGFTFIAVAVSAFAAFNAVQSARFLTKQNNSIAAVIDIIKDQTFREGMKVLTEKMQAKDGLLNLSRGHNRFSKEGMALRYTLNYLEHTCIAIKHDIYDINIVKETLCDTFIHVWDGAQPFIKKRVDINPSAYQALKDVVLEWKLNPDTIDTNVPKEEGRNLSGIPAFIMSTILLFIILFIITWITYFFWTC